MSHLPVLLLLLLSPFATAAEPTWRAGLAREVITPERPMWMSGYAARKKPAEGTRHDLWAKALVLEDAAGERAVLVTLDLVGIGRELSLAILADLGERHGLEPRQVALCTSHTHTGPVVGRNLGTMYFLDGEQQRLVDEYATSLHTNVVDVVGRAIADLAPATLSQGTGEATFAVNRRNNREADVPMLREEGKLLGPVDHAVPVLVVRDPETGRPRAIVAGYACHATTLADFEWSGDWPGCGQTELEARFPGATAMFWAGCGADQNPIPRRSPELAEQYGRMFADAVAAVVEGETSAVEPRLRTVRSELDLAFGALPTREQIEGDTASDNEYVAARAKELLAALDRDGALPVSYPYPVQVWRLGNVTWAILGGEVTVEYALRLRAELPDPAWVAGYSNDVMAYIPSKRVLLEGGYEGGGAMVYYGLPTAWSENVEEQVVGEVWRLVAALDEEGGKAGGGQQGADAPRSPDVSHVRVPEGFEVSVAAGPPLVTHPMMACFDEVGRLYVCENAGVNLSAEELEEQLPNSIRRLEDTNGDGVFDRATVFADRMTFPMGCVWHEGSLFVASPPHIWRLADTDDDGVADVRTPIVGKFGYTGNAASIHGCFLSPTGRLWWCDGYHGHEFRDADGNVTSSRKGSYIFSCEPDGSDVRIHCGGGMDNPVELDFTEEGEPIGTVNILYTRPRVDALVHWQRGGVYPHREGILEEMPITGELLGPIHRFGHVAVSGTTRYRGTHLDPGWTNDFFVTFFNRGRVVRMELERSGATFTATEREFLASSSRDFHPTDVLEDADGSLLVLDTGGWFYRGCPTSQMPKPEELGSILRIRRSGAKPVDDPRGNAIAWARLESADVVDFFDDERFVVRERAIAEIGRREGEDVLSALSAARISDSVTTRVNSVWALARRMRHPNRELRGPATILASFSAREPDPRVRQAALCAIGEIDREFGDRPVPVSFRIALRDESAAVRRQAATTLGALGDDLDDYASLVGSLEHAVDRTEEHAIVYALIEIGTAPRSGLTHASAKVRRGVLVARDQIMRIRQTASEVAPLLDDPDARVRREAIRILLAHSDWEDLAATRLSGWLAGDVGGRADDVRRVVTGFAGREPVAELIGRVLASEETPAEVRRILLAGLSAANRPAVHETWVAPLERSLGGDDATRDAALDVVANLRSERFDDALTRLGADASLPRTVRVRALEAARRSSGIGDEAFALLLEMLDGPSPAEVAEAGRRIGGATLSKPQLVALAPRLVDAGPLLLRDLLGPYARNQDHAVGGALLAALDEARSLTSLPPHEFSDVVKRYPPELLPRANALLDRLYAADDALRARIDGLLERVATGNVERGREVFFGEKSKCATCHRVGEKGGRIGPDLTTIGANRAPRDLVESIVFPSATLVREYEPYTLVTARGLVLSGLVVRETPTALHLQPATGDPVVVPRDEIESLVPSTVSIMPKGLDEALGERELADVVAYLVSLRAEGVAARPGDGVDDERRSKAP